MDQLIAFHRIFGSCVLGPPQKDYFFAVPWRESFGRILTMQLEPPKMLEDLCGWTFRHPGLTKLCHTWGWMEPAYRRSCYHIRSHSVKPTWTLLVYKPAHLFTPRTYRTRDVLVYKPAHLFTPRTYRTRESAAYPVIRRRTTHPGCTTNQKPP